MAGSHRYNLNLRPSLLTNSFLFLEFAFSTVISKQMDPENQNIDDVESPEKTQPVPQAQVHPADQQFSGDQQHEMYEQQEDGPYYDEEGNAYYDDQEGDEVTGHLKETRLNKKKAADDAKLLANRIALLKMEERKAWKKIQETKRKAEQVMQVR